MHSLGAFGASDKKLEIVYQDSKTGLEWSRKIPGVYSNGCKGTDGFLNVNNCSAKIETGQDSDAQMACLERGGRLPTLEEFRTLFKNFDISDNISFEKLRLPEEQERRANGADRISELFGTQMEYDSYATATIKTWPADSIYGAYSLAYSVGLIRTSGITTWAYFRSPQDSAYRLRDVICVKL